MFKTLARACVAVSAVTLLAGFATAGSVHADGPLGGPDFSGLGTSFDLTGLVPTPVVQGVTAPPEAPIEAPAVATTTENTTPAVAPAEVPGTAGSPGGLKLPSTGSGTAAASHLPMLAVVLAIGGIACAGAAHRTRTAAVEA
jgi:hypothetical protein